jgi:glycosyltransferase involved in cell wall biosynthesis
MRIDHLVHQFPPETRGGLETYVVDLALSQIAAGDDVAIVSGSLEPRTSFEVVESEHLGLQVTRLHRADLYFDAWDKGAHPEVEAALRDRWRDRRPDVVHVHHWIRLTENLVEIARDLEIPVVVTLHDFAPSCPRAFRMYAADGSPCFRETKPDNCGPCAHRWPWYDDAAMAQALSWFRRNSRAELGRAGARLCASSAVAALIAKALDLDPQDFKVLPLGYEPRFSGRRARPSASGGSLRVAYWGSVTERKGVAFLAAALERVRQTGAEVSLDVFGRIDRPELEAEIREAAGELSLTLHGRYEYAELAEAEIDLAVFPSLCLETYGLVVDEAQELGLPIVVPAEGAMAERVAGGGLSFPIGDGEGLTAVLLRLAQDRDELERLRQQVQPPGQDLSHHRDELAAVYRDVIAAPPEDDARASLAIPARDRQGQAFARAELLFRTILQQG